MRAKEEYSKWCALERLHENRFSPEQERAYITGFSKAIELMEKFLKEKQDETKNFQ